MLTIANANAKALVAAGIDSSLAREIGVKAANQVRKALGGTQFYVPKSSSLDIVRRDLQILEEFNGSNHAELAQKFNLTVRRIYDIIAEQG